MQHIPEVKVLLLIIRRLLSPVAAEKETLCVVLCIGKCGSWDNPHGSHADFPSSLHALAWSKSARVL